MFVCTCKKCSPITFQKSKSVLSIFSSVKMGDAEDQEVQEGPVENAWALKVSILWSPKNNAALFRCLSSQRQTIHMVCLKKASLLRCSPSIGRSTSGKFGRLFRLALEDNEWFAKGFINLLAATGHVLRVPCKPRILTDTDHMFVKWSVEISH